MIKNVQSIFNQNIELLGLVSKGVYYFRCQEYEKALRYVADSVNGINIVVDGVMNETGYFHLVETESVLEMLEGILDAKKKGDYILLADIYELQLSSFICSIQEFIISREEFSYNVATYENNNKMIKEMDAGLYEQLEKPADPLALLEKGYCVEYTSSGLMTLATVEGDSKFYMHTNSHVMEEAFLLAETWYEEKVSEYSVYGLGFGYHVLELAKKNPNAKIHVYEGDLNVIRLACAFTDLKKVFQNKNVNLVYDPDYHKLIKNLEQGRDDGIKFLMHYPSFRNIRGDQVKRELETYFPWTKIIKNC